MSRRHARVWLAWLLVAALSAAGIGGIAVTRGSAASGSDTSVRIGSDLSVPPSGSTTVALEVLGVPTPGVGAVTVDIVYDPDVVEPGAWAAGSGWSSVLCNLQATANTVRCAAVNVTGVSGDSLLASLTFEAGDGPSLCSVLEAQVVTFTDPNGNPMPVSSQSGQVCISTSLTPAGPEPGPTPTPLPPSNRSPTASPMASASPDKAGSVQLVPGCNPVVSTWPDGTDPVVIASSTDRPWAVAAIWKFDQAATTWLGFSPAVPANVTDIFRVQNLDVVFVCVDDDALLTRPEA